ncbi:hypothetical protein FAES_2436 [Fibrella aestuarina BUZ 2]|uniref:DUF4199 domain-containing protein n=1 Tax=Fibrella aestuarina BUZ 2 TaxID=1166018 RepID=I0K8J2_9BACT|nr:DUF4199 domain-containing protein [Fibrella aestuarina]CCH00445.1 hypothetical protein FAES_2436 [Fibrella aestuarina BUZ 2]
MQKTILIFGTLSGLLVSTVLLVTMLIHRQNPDSFNQGELVGYVAMLLSASFIPIAIKRYRDQQQAGQISFKQAFGLGLGVATIASVLYVLTWIVIFKTVYPNFVSDYTQFMLNRLQSEGKTLAQIAEAKQSMQSMFVYYDTWPGLIGITFMEIFPIGLLVALISALVLKKTNARFARV